MKADYAWQELYGAAVLETDNGKLAERLLVLKARIDTRLLELQRDQQVTREERQAIRDALKGLDVLRKDLERRSHETGSSKARMPLTTSPSDSDFNTMVLTPAD
ncbi:MAG TPA: hypothetical protein VF905_12630, partial [Nitrospirota bacterium]